jgi:hypothetical protein
MGIGRIVPEVEGVGFVGGDILWGEYSRTDDDRSEDETAVIGETAARLQQQRETQTMQGECRKSDRGSGISE